MCSIQENNIAYDSDKKEYFVTGLLKIFTIDRLVLQMA